MTIKIFSLDQNILKFNISFLILVNILVYQIKNIETIFLQAFKVRIFSHRIYLLDIDLESTILK